MAWKVIPNLSKSVWAGLAVSNVTGYLSTNGRARWVSLLAFHLPAKVEKSGLDFIAFDKTIGWCIISGAIWSGWNVILKINDVV